MVVGVHGNRGKAKKAAGIAKWVDEKDNVIVLAPQFPQGYQGAEPSHQRKLLKMFEDIKKKYKVHPKMFLYGFSGGSQFTHPFAMYQPEYVCGVSAHSGGSWALSSNRMFGIINTKAKGVIFAVSCGESDQKKSWPEAMYGRLDWFKQFVKEMKEGGFCFKQKTWPGVGHKKTPGSWEMTEDCFQLATSGISNVQSKSINSKLAEIETLMKKIKNIPQKMAMEKLVLSYINKMKSDKPASSKELLAFMNKTPPALWKEREDAKELLAACNKTAEEYVTYLRGKNKVTTSFYSKYIPIWKGLKIAEALEKEYDEKAQKSLDKILKLPASRSKVSKLKTFVRKWKVGKAVE